jgi:uncharacterized repeat protein (TIGR01451 family)
VYKLEMSLAAVAGAAGALAAFAVCGAAAAPMPSWSIESRAPTYFVPGKVGFYDVLVTNAGTVPAEEVTVTDKLPAGVEVKSMSLYWSLIESFDLGPYFCSHPTGQDVTCSFPASSVFGVTIEPGQTVRMVIEVTVSSPVSEGPIVNEAAVEGGGAARASTFSQSVISSHPSFGIPKFTMQATRAMEVPGTRERRRNREPISHENDGFVNIPYSFTQADGHPDSITTKIEFAQEGLETEEGPVSVPTRDPKNIAVALPPGFLGNPTAVPSCSLKQALAFGAPCPASTQVGVAVIYLLAGQGLVGPIVNVTPEAGQSAEFAIETNSKINFLLTGHVVRTSEGYGLAVVSTGNPSTLIVGLETTFWGVPASEVHDPERGLFCGRLSGETSPWGCGMSINGVKNGEFIGLGEEKSGEPEVPFLTMPGNCAAGPETVGIRADSWEEPGAFVSASTTLPGATGCGLLQFAPGIVAEPDSLLADAPVGLGVNVTVPQFESPERLSTPELRSAAVTLPLGMSVNPAIVDGIQACDESGPEGIDFTGPESEEVGLNGELQLAAGHCPDASIVGTAEAITPLLSEPVKGHVYLARPGCGGPGEAACTEEDAVDGNLYKLYLELGGTGPLASTGVHLKIPGEAQVNPATGQITTRFEGLPAGNPPHFEGNPQLPFSELKVRLNGGPRAPLANPPVCGAAVTTADFKPWSAPGTTPEGVFVEGLPDATPSSFFSVEGCASPPGLSPGFVAGTVTANAGKFSAFTLNLSRKDREQYIMGVRLHTPEGLLGMLSSVPLCGEAEADAGTCPQASKIGTTRVASGAGSHPFEVEGSMYLTGPHDGAPFGLSVVTHAVAGPFNLGLVVVRARIEVDRTNSTLTVSTDESGPYALPQILFGVPLRLQRITVDVDRPGFMFNPTNCKAQRITAEITGSQGAAAGVVSPFAVGGCKSLGFKPQFSVSTSGKTSRAKGASLDAKLSYPKGAMGNDANIAKAKVSLPTQLPSRLNTLQKACPVQTFNANPAACPAASIVGIARASTPVLPVGLTGPVYFVSHGGEAFPQLIIVLEGDGVRVDLAGSTFISKGITSSTFKTVPDVPVNTFELYLPQGRNSALAANGSLCKQKSKLVMPTEFTAQNGMVIRQRTKIQVGQCGPSRKPRRTRARGARRQHHGKGRR